jgi:hypothetical protein
VEGEKKKLREVWQQDNIRKGLERHMAMKYKLFKSIKEISRIVVCPWGV